MNQTMGLEAALVRYAGGAVLEAHAHGSGSVSVVLAGTIEETVGRTTECGQVGSIVAKPPEIEHSNRVGPSGAILLAIRGGAADEVAARGWRWGRSGGAAAAGLEVARHLKAGAALHSDQLLDLLGFAYEARPASEATRRPAWLNAIRARLDHDPLAVTELAELADVHPVYLTRAFRKRFGCSIREYRRRQRVRRAADLLAGSTLPIVEIAARLDYFDQSHLCRDFKAELALSPGDYRTIVRS